MLPECVDDYVGEDNPVRVVEAFVVQLDRRAMVFEGIDPLATGRPSRYSAELLKIYIYGYLTRIQSGRRLEHETRRSVELRWLIGRTTPDFKTIANFRKDNGPAIRKAPAVHRAVPAVESVCAGRVPRVNQAEKSASIRTRRVVGG